MDYVDQVVKTNPVVVFSKKTCPFCVKTKETLKKANIDFFEVELVDRPEIHDALKEYSG